MMDVAYNRAETLQKKEKMLVWKKVVSVGV